MQKKAKVTLSRLIGASAAVALLCQPMSSFAESHDVEPGESHGWEFDLKIYGWGKSVDGTSASRDVNLDFKDQVIDLIDGVFMTTFGAEKGKLLLWGTYEYTKLKTDKRDVNTTIDYPIPILSRSIPVDVSTVADATDVQHMVELGAGWNVLENKKWDASLHGGVRYFDYELKVFVDPITAQVVSPINGEIIERIIPQQQIVLGDDWYQPFIGARAGWQFAQKWRLHGRLDFGYNPFTSDDSNQSWMTALMLDWNFTHWAGLEMGYRYMVQDFDNGKNEDNFSWVMDEYGPVIAVNFRF